MSLLHLYRHPGHSASQTVALLRRAQGTAASCISAIDTEFCFNIAASRRLTAPELDVLRWLLAETFEPEGFADRSLLPAGGQVLEVGPRMSFTTAWSTNAVAVCHACGLDAIQRIERSRRYRVTASRPLTDAETAAFLALAHDRMTECPYPRRLESFESGVTPAPVFEVPVLREGRAALERINRELGLAFDDWDLDYYTDLFRTAWAATPPASSASTSRSPTASTRATGSPVGATARSGPFCGRNDGQNRDTLDHMGAHVVTCGPGTTVLDAAWRELH
jgi:phosphoribosylformylglycinamidine synthase